jgi:CheY-like chemotaxis protein
MPSWPPPGGTWYREAMPSEKSIILVVEDEKESRETLRELLELEGYRVETAVNGREALDTLNASGDRICIMLLDLFMPVMDGWQVIDQLRADGRLASTQVVIITSAPHRAPAGLPVFQKPLDLDKVMHEVQSLC